MKCYKVRELLADYHKGNLESQQETDIREHLSHCSECVKESAFLKEYLTDLRTARPNPITTSSDYMFRLNNRINSEESQKRWRFRLSPSVMGLAGATAVTFLLVLAVINPQSIFVVPRKTSVDLSLSAPSITNSMSAEKPQQELESIPPLEKTTENRENIPIQRSAKRERSSSTIIITLRTTYEKARLDGVESIKLPNRVHEIQDNVDNDSYGDKKAKEKLQIQTKPTDSMPSEIAFDDEVSTPESLRNKTINLLIDELGGKVLKEDYQSSTGLLQRISGSLPAKSYPDFMIRLAEFGTIESIDNSSADNDVAVVPFELRFLD